MGSLVANADSTIFNKKAAEKLRSPDDLDKYVRVTNPSVWVVLAACVALLTGLLAWGVFGAVTTSVSATGTCLQGGEVVCFLAASDAAQVSVGDEAKVGDKQMKVSTISALPISRDEAQEIVRSDYLLSSLVNGDWTYVVHFEGEGTDDFNVGYPLTVNITTDRVAPISLIFKG